MIEGLLKRIPEPPPDQIVADTSTTTTTASNEIVLDIITPIVSELARDALFHHKNHIDIVRASLYILKRLAMASSEAALALSADNELANLLRQLMRDFAHDAALVEAGLGLMSRLGQQRRAMGQIGANDDDDDESVLLFNLSAAPRSRNVALAAVRALGRLKVEEHSVNADEFVIALQEMQETWSMDEEIMNLAVEAMEMLFPEHLAKSRKAIPVEVTMSLEELIEYILHSELSILRTLHLDAANRLVEEICAPTDESRQLLIGCCKALSRLNEAFETERTLQVWRGKGIIGVVRVLREDVENALALVWIVKLLGKLCAHEKIRSLIGLHSGISALLAVLRRFKDVSEQRVLLMCICETLALLAHHTPANITEIVVRRFTLISASLSSSSSPSSPSIIPIAIHTPIPIMFE